MVQGINQKQTTTDAYVGIQGGAYSSGENPIANIGITLGGEVRKGGTFANAELSAGTSLGAKLEAGHEFDIGRNMGLVMSGNAEYVRNNFESESRITLHTLDNTITELTDKTIVSTTNQEFNFGQKWHDGYKKAGAGLAFNFKGKRGNIKAGMEAGYRAELGYNNPHFETTQTKPVETNFINDKNSGFYATPTISANLNLGKKGHWALTANADMYQGKAGVRYTF